MEFILILLIVGLDQLTKYLIVDQHVQMPLIPNVLYVTNAYNTGSAWSLFSSQISMLTLISAVASVLILGYMIVKKRQGANRFYLFILALMAAGAIGNLIDRILFQYVRDFIGVIIFGYYFPIFNIADISLTCSVILLIVYSLIEEGYLKVWQKKI